MTVPMTVGELRSLKTGRSDQVPPTDCHGSVEAHVRHATRALLAFGDIDAPSASDQETVSTVVGDLLADLWHLADQLGLEWDELLMNGRKHYDLEQAAEGGILPEEV